MTSRQAIQERLDANEKEFAGILRDMIGGFYVTDHSREPTYITHAKNRYIEARMWLERFMSSSEF